jgi:RNA polymerase sigma-70 factor (ECF subfamily)
MDTTRRKAIHDAMVRLADGDRSAFDALLDELWPVILAFVRRGVGQDADAEDVAQEVFVRICARIADFDRSRDGLSWAFGIASYEVMTWRRRAQRRREARDDDALEAERDGAASQEELLLATELGRAFEQAVGALTDDDRRALGLACGEAPQDVGGATLRKRRQRALDRLRAIWRAIHGEP